MNRSRKLHNWLCPALAFVLYALPCLTAHAQDAPPSNDPGFYQEVGEDYLKIELSAGTSRVLRFPYDIPKIVVNNDVVSARPISPNEIMVQGTRPGISSLYVHDSAGKVQTIDIVVLADVRPLQEALHTLFPAAQVAIRPLNQSVVVTGFTANSEQTYQVMEVVRDYFPTAINQLRVDGNHTVLLTAKVFEVSRTKLRRHGIDWAAVLAGDFLISNPGNTISLQSFFDDGVIAGQSSVVGGIVDNGNQFTFLLDMLEQDNLAKVLADTQLVADSGRAASLLSGGRIPIPISNGLTTSVQFEEFGTALDCVPIVQEDGQIRLEILAEVSDVAGDLRDSVTGTPGFRTRTVNTAVTVPAGKTIAIAGIIQNRVDAELKGVPYLKEMPYVGSLFRRTVQTFNEVDLVVIIRPEFVAPVDPCELPTPPGQHTVAPSDYDMYVRGHIEVPSRCPESELGPIVPESFHGPDGNFYESVPMQDLPQVPMQAPQQAPAIEPIQQTTPVSTAARPRVTVEKLPEAPTTQGQYLPSSRRATEAPTSSPADSQVLPQLMGPSGYDGIDVSARPRTQR